MKISNMHRRRWRIMLLSVVLACLMLTTCFAAENTLPEDVYCFTQEDFSSGTGGSFDGIFVTSVPDHAIGVVTWGQREIRPGDILPTDSLASLILTPCCETEQNAIITYLPIVDGTVGAAQSVCIKIRDAKNLPPVATDTTFETYKNIPNEGTLLVSDPEGDALQFAIVQQPKRGTVALKEDGTFLYTPNKNKVGKDSFTFTATDAVGNTSNEATISVRISKPLDKATYADLEGSNLQYEALWMRSAGLYSGCTVAGKLCFGPNEPVSRGEFLAMVMRLKELPADSTDLQSGFADQEEAAAWMQPYVVSAMRLGIVDGYHSEEGLVFRGNDPITRAEAAVLLQNVLNLEDDTITSVAAIQELESVPAWAVSAMCAMHRAGLPLDLHNATASMTRSEAVILLYAVSCME